MSVSYKKLWKLLIDKDMTRTELRRAIGASSSTFAKLSHGEFISGDMMARICGALDCNVGDMMESARNMASLVVTREGEGHRTINIFEFDEAASLDAGLSIRRFANLDEDWMRFVVANRSFERETADHNLDRLYDIVIGFNDHLRLYLYRPFRHSHHAWDQACWESECVAREKQEERISEI